MTPEQLVPSLEKCQALVKAGWKKETLFYWSFAGNPPRLMTMNETGEERTRRINDFSPLDFTPIYVPAPTLAEILAELPNRIIKDLDIYYVLEMIEKTGFNYMNYDDEGAFDNAFFDFPLSPADLYIKLAEEGLI